MDERIELAYIKWRVGQQFNKAHLSFERLKGTGHPLFRKERGEERIAPGIRRGRAFPHREFTCTRLPHTCMRHRGDRERVSGLLAIQDPVRAWLVRRMGEGHDGSLEKLTWLPVGLASVYGGYFGAGLSVIVLSALGLTMEDTLTRLNALKQAVAFSVNIAAAIFFIFSGQVVWSAMLVMAGGALLGGALGGTGLSVRVIASLW